MKIIYLPARDIVSGKSRDQGPRVRFSKVLVTVQECGSWREKYWCGKSRRFYGGKTWYARHCTFFSYGFFFCFNQAKLRLEMAAEHDKHVAQKEMETKDEEIEQLRSNMQKKVWAIKIPPC